MDHHTDSLYGLLCRLFNKVNCGNQLGTENALKARQPKVVGFETLLAARSSEKNDISYIHTHLYKLRCTGAVGTKSLDAIERLLDQMEKDTLNDCLPVLNLLVRLKPTVIESESKLIKFGYNQKHLSLNTLMASPIKEDFLEESSMTSLRHYQPINPSLFLVKSLPFESTELSNISSWAQFSKLDMVHRNLFGALRNPPSSLDFLGISRRSKLQLSLHHFKKTEIQAVDEGFCSESAPSSPRPSTPESKEDFDCWEDLSDLDSPITKTWESHLKGEYCHQKELPYLTEAPVAVMEQLWNEWQKNVSLIDESFVARQVVQLEEKDLRRHLLYLTLGVESVLFVYDAGLDHFRTTVECSVNGLTVDCLAQVMRPFIECGRLVRRLNALEWNSEDGLVFNALVNVVRNVMLFHHRVMKNLEETTTSLMALATKVKTLLGPLRLLDRLLVWSWWARPGRGVLFLQHVLHLANHSVDQPERRLLTTIFCNCVLPFLAYLHRWVYFGECCDPYGEFPIEVADGHLSRRDRGYWTHGFHLRDLRLSSEDSSESLQQDEGLLGLLADVYVCGKSVHLLHLCTTAKAREDRQEPGLRIALSLVELGAVMKRCAEHAERRRVPDVGFVEQATNVAEEAQRKRAAKLAELEEALRVQKAAEAAKKSQRCADYKAELDDQLEAKQVEAARKRDAERLEDAKVAEYQELLIERQNQEKLRLMRKYAKLLNGDRVDGVGDGAGESEAATTQMVRALSDDESNANSKLATLDKENNWLDGSPTAAGDAASDTDRPPTRYVPTFPWDTAPDGYVFAEDDVGTVRKARWRRWARPERYVPTLEEIRAKVMRVEFGWGQETVADSTKKGDAAPAVNESLRRAVQWCAPPAPTITAYRTEFGFGGRAFDWLKEPCGWLRESRPDFGQIDSLSLTFFVERSLLLPVRTQCQLTNRSLMAFLVEEQKLMKHFETLRQFLFLDNGSFGQSLVSCFGPHLGSITSLHQLVNIPAMNFILQSALNAVRADETYASHLSFYIKEIGPGVAANSVEALDCFTLRYRIGWPLNLILTDDIMDDYSLIFSFLLQLRLAAWAMEDVYVGLKELGRQWHAVQIARQSMHHFVQTLQHYVMNQLLNLSWREFIVDLQKNAASLDDLYDVHWRYIHQAKSRLLLTGKSASLMKIIRDALNLTLHFRSRLVACHYQHGPTIESQIASISRKFGEYTKFLHLVLEKVNDRSHQCHLSELLVLFNYNGFYSI